MTAQDCTAIIAAIGAAQIAMIAALGALYVKVHSTEQVVKMNARSLAEKYTTPEV